MSGIYKDVTNDDLPAFLREAAVYFRKRPTGGEDMAFWANEANAERCEKGADTIASLTEEVERLRAHLKTCPCPGGGWNGMPSDMEATIDNCVAHGACGCCYGAALQSTEQRT